MVDTRMVEGLPEIEVPTDLCEACLYSKQPRTSCPKHTKFRVKEHLELVHGVHYGPITPPSPAINMYFMLLVDDYTWVLWVYMLKNKNDALKFFKKCRAQVEVETILKLKVFRSDHGGEFLATQLTIYYDEIWLKGHYTTPYPLQQNDVVEGHYQTVLEMQRNNLKGIDIPEVIWGEGVSHSV